jgi:hypothetical protein
MHLPGISPKDYGLETRLADMCISLAVFMMAGAKGASSDLRQGDRRQAVGLGDRQLAAGHSGVDSAP